MTFKQSRSGLPCESPASRSFWILVRLNLWSKVKSTRHGTLYLTDARKLATKVLDSDCFFYGDSLLRHPCLRASDSLPIYYNLLTVSDLKESSSKYQGKGMQSEEERIQKRSVSLCMFQQHGG